MRKIALEELGAVVAEVLAALPQSKTKATILALSGELGAGKTTFTQALGHRLGIIETIQSPTYVLMKLYPIAFAQYAMFIHIDAYRLGSPDEFKTLKPETFLNDPKNLVCVEWPERLGKELSTPDLTIKFSADGAGEGERYIEIV